MSESISARIAYAIRRRLTKPEVERIATGGQQHSGPRLSLVVATYNVEAYIDRFLASVFGQSSHLKRFEVIIVDDGSTDGTADIVRKWQDRYPHHLRYVHQENAGASAARNAGLALATGKWVSFPDPDDFLSVNYFRDMLKETEVRHELPLLAVISNLVFYFEDTDRYSDSHPLKYKFRSGKVTKTTDDMGAFIHLSGASIWIDREAIRSHDLAFDSRVKPTFEDAHLINRIFLANPGRSISFVPSATYYYRKRSDKSSQVDQAKTQRSWYIDRLKYGYLSLLEIAARDHGNVPRYIQRTCFYDLFWTFRYLVNHSYRVNFMTKGDIAEFQDLLKQIFAFIDTEVIESFELSGCNEEHKVALLQLYKNTRRDSIAVYVRDIDLAAELVQLSYYVGGDDSFDPEVHINYKIVEPLLPSCRRTEFLGRPYFQQKFIWVPLRDNQTISCELDGQSCRIRYYSKAIGESTDWLTLRNIVEKSAPSISTLEADARRRREHAIATRPKYHGCWVLIDQDARADDNAEHLYRHLIKTGRTENAWFIVAEGSKDWLRLKDEGFKLLPYGSDDHIAAQTNAAALISSHADQHILWPGGKAGLEDLVHSDFIFLQHGVTTNDVSDWLNFKPIRLFITSMPEEAAALSDPNGPYTFTARETLFCGFPRHDSLLAKKETAKEDLILLAPTWRKYLTIENDSVGERRLKHERFAQSDFGLNWSEVLTSERLRDIAQACGLKILLVPHPNMAMYLEDLSIPDWIETVDVRKGISYQDLLSRARIAVTDYSSAISDVAFLQRPVLYFQFDADEIFKGDHVYKKGFFDFERDGFGALVKSAPEVVNHIDEILSGRENPMYATRRNNAFPFRDGESSERVVQAIERLQNPRPTLSPLYASQKIAKGGLSYK